MKDIINILLIPATITVVVYVICECVSLWREINDNSDGKKQDS